MMCPPCRKLRGLFHSLIRGLLSVQFFCLSKILSSESCWFLINLLRTLQVLTVRSVYWVPIRANEVTYRLCYPI